MNRTTKIVGIVVAILIIILIAIPLFVNANTFRPKLESELTNALGRQVEVGNLSLSLFSGGVTADNILIADDPDFSKTPFVQAKSLKVGVEMIPLIFSKTLHVTEVTLNQPQIGLVKSQDGTKWNFSSLGAKNPPSSTASQPATEVKTSQPQGAGGSAANNPSVSVAKLNIEDGQVTLSRAGSSEPPRVYDKVTIAVTNLSLVSAFPFKMSVELPGGGSLNLDGKAGPFNAGNAEATPLEAKISVKGMNLAQSGFIDPASGISGVADFDGTVNSDGHTAKATGVLQASKLQVVQKGSPAGEPVQVTYTIVHDLAKQSGEITQGDVALGKAVAHLTGTYAARGDITAVELKLIGQEMPVDDLEAMLPAVGVVLPPKSTLKGGDLNLNLAISGPVNKLVTTGTVRLENSSITNFDMGSKLSSISALNGKKTGNDTMIQNFSSDVRVAPEGTQANNIDLDVPAIGVITGDGSVSPANELAFKMKASLGGMGIPFDVEGTTSDPKFVPDVKGMATGLVKGLGGKGEGAASGLTGLLKKKPH
jgi:AsmA protein